jgi:hypothetical protein
MLEDYRGERNCSLCAIVFPACKRKKQVHIGYCRSPFFNLKLAFSHNDQMRTEESFEVQNQKQAIPIEIAFNHKQETEKMK